MRGVISYIRKKCMRSRSGNWWAEVTFNADGASMRFIAGGAISELSGTGCDLCSSCDHV
jgi:hypothetical protein